MNFSRCVEKIRHDRGWIRADISELLDVSPSSYQRFERDAPKYNATVPRAIMNAPEAFTEKEFEKIRAAFKIKRIRESRGEDSQRIRNIPNFYRDLNAIGDLSTVDVNDPRVQRLRVKVGGEKVYSGGSY